MYNKGVLVYNGNWQDNLPHGKGKEFYVNGDIYEGEFKNGKKIGKGKFLFKDGAKYTGEVLNNKFHGTGQFSCRTHTYNGLWKENLKCGQGKLEY